MSALVTQEDLKNWSDYQRPGDIERWLIDNHIPFFHGKGGCLCTTQTAIDKALMGEQQQQDEQIRF